MSRKDFWVFIALGISLAALFGHVFVSTEGNVLSYLLGDTRLMFMQMRQFSFGEIAAGRLPLWNPFILGGMPCIGETQTAVFYPLNLLFFCLLPFEKALNGIMVFQMFLSGIFMYLFVRKLDSCEFGAALSAFSFMFSSVFMNRILGGHQVDISVLCWLPALFWLNEKFIHKPRFLYAVFAGIVYGLMLLAGHPQQLFFISVGFLIYASLRFLFEKGFHAWLVEGLTFTATMVVIGCGFGAIQLFPTLEFSGNSTRAFLDTAWQGKFCEAYSFPPENLICFLFPDFFGDFENVFYWGRWLKWEMCHYVGISTLIMVFWSFSSEKRKIFFPLFALALACLVLALGSYLPTFKLVKAVSFLRRFRGYSKFIAISCFALSALGGIGFSELISDIRQKRIAFLEKAWLGILLLIPTFFFFAFWFLEKNCFEIWVSLLKLFQGYSDKTDFFKDPSFFERSFAFALTSMKFGFTLIFASGLTIFGFLKGISSRRTTVCLIFLVLFIDLLKYCWPVSRTVFPSTSIGFTNEIHEFLKRDKEPFRISTPFCRNQNDAIALGFESINGYESLVWRRYAEFFNLSQGLSKYTPIFYFDKVFPSKMLDLLNVKYWIVPKALPTIPKTLKPLFTSEIFNVCESETFIPRYQLISTAVSCKDEQEVIQALNNPSFDPRKTLILEEQAPFASCEENFEVGRKVYLFSNVHRFKPFFSFQRAIRLGYSPSI